MSFLVIIYSKVILTSDLNNIHSVIITFDIKVSKYKLHWHQSILIFINFVESSWSKPCFVKSNPNTQTHNISIGIDSPSQRPSTYVLL